MKYMKRRRRVERDDFLEEEPLSGVANLFDLALVLFVGLLLMFFSVFRLSIRDVSLARTDITIVKRGKDNKPKEIIVKRGKEVKAMRVTNIQAEGRGQRLGTAYRLEDGSIVYVPD